MIQKGGNTSGIFDYLWKGANDNVPENVSKAEAKGRKVITGKNANKKFNQSSEPRGLKRVSASDGSQHGMMSGGSRKTRDELASILGAALIKAGL